MINLNISEARTDLYKLASSCIRNNNVINISTIKGNVILMSEKRYNSLIESLYLMGNNNVNKDIEKACKSPTSEFSRISPWEQ